MRTIDQVLADKLDNWYVGEWPIGNIILCAIALVLCVLLCGAVGLEREKRGRTAGLRTHLLVGVGSCILMIVSIYGFPEIKTSEGTILTRDVARLAAQVVAGVGFLGAGAIIHRNSGTRGLTTAATIWIAMAIGLACGSMNFFLAIGGTVLILVVLTLFRKLESRISKKRMLVVVRSDINSPIVGKIMESAKEFELSVFDLHSEIDDDGFLEITFLAKTNSEDLHKAEFISKLEVIEGVKSVQILNSNKM